MRSFSTSDTNECREIARREFAKSGEGKRTGSRKGSRPPEIQSKRSKGLGRKMEGKTSLGRGFQGRVGFAAKNLGTRSEWSFGPVKCGHTKVKRNDDTQVFDRSNEFVVQ